MTHARFGFALAAVVGFVAALAAQAPTQTKPPQEDEFLKGTVAATTAGLTLPKATTTVHPKYTPDAMRAKLQGSVKVQVVVGVDGRVDRARVTESLDKNLGLDDAALAAAKQFRFEPAKLNDQAVPVAVELILEFRLH